MKIKSSLTNKERANVGFRKSLMTILNNFLKYKNQWNKIKIVS
jgi:hypothetical protein